MLLIKEGLVKEEDIEKALEIQRRKAEEAKIPLGEILIKKSLISRDQLKILLAHPDIRKNIGIMIIEEGFMDRRQLSECLKRKGPNDHFGDLLIKEGYITNKDLKILLDKQLNGMKLGELALKLNMIDEKDLEDTLKMKSSQRTIGQILCDLKLITPSDLNRVLLKMYSQKLKLGQILLKQGVIDDEKLKTALHKQSESDEPLGNILIQKKLITVNQLYSALAMQCNTTFKKLEHFVFDQTQKNALCSIVGQTFAEKNQILPLSLEINKLTLAVSNPKNINCIDELKLGNPDIQMNCVFITNKKFPQLFVDLYGKPLSPGNTSMQKNPQFQKFNQTVSEGENEKLIISDPETESVLVDRLFERYKMFQQRMNIILYPSDISLFKEFIKDNYKKICSKFHCSRVTFYIGVNTDKVEIIASPNN